jgi:hypothetical protein
MDLTGVIKLYACLFQSGAFVVLKTDFQNGGDPPIWKIDGKALLQKYVPFEQDGKTLYKNTSTVSMLWLTRSVLEEAFSTIKKKYIMCLICNYILEFQCTNYI